MGPGLNNNLHCKLFNPLNLRRTPSPLVSTDQISSGQLYDWNPFFIKDDQNLGQDDEWAMVSTFELRERVLLDRIL